jgi:type II secretory pathway component PulM
MQKILNKREKIVLYTTVGIIIFSIAFNLFIEPTLSRNETLNKEINIARLKLNKYLKLLSQKE